MFPPLFYFIVGSPVIGIVYFVLCLLIAILGRNRIMGFWGYFFGSIILTPMIGFLLFSVSAKKEKI